MFRKVKLIHYWFQMIHNSWSWVFDQWNIDPNQWNGKYMEYLWYHSKLGIWRKPGCNYEKWRWSLGCKSINFYLLCYTDSDYTWGCPSWPHQTTPWLRKIPHQTSPGLTSVQHLNLGLFTTLHWALLYWPSSGRNIYHSVILGIFLDLKLCAIQCN